MKKILNISLSIAWIFYALVINKIAYSIETRLFGMILMSIPIIIAAAVINLDSN